MIDDNDHATLAKELLGGKYAGKVVLVAWHHGTIPMLARALGATPPYDPWPETQFDRVWRIDYRGGKAVLTELPQGLMAGDSAGRCFEPKKRGDRLQEKSDERPQQIRAASPSTFVNRKSPVSTGRSRV